MAIKKGKIKLFESIKNVVTKPFKTVRNTIKNGNSNDKKALVIKTVGAGIIGATILSGCVANFSKNKNKDTDYVKPSTSISVTDDTTNYEKDELENTTTTTTTENTTTTNTTTSSTSTQTTTTTIPEDSYFLSDDLEDTEITVEDNLNKEEDVVVEEDSNKENIEDVISDDNATNDSNKDVVINDNTSEEVVKPDVDRNDSEDVYNDNTNNTDNNENNSDNSINTPALDEAYMDADGYIWGSYQAYLDYINYDVTDDLYCAPDGSYWDSEELYLNDQNNQSKEDVSDNEAGKGSENSEYYYDAETDTYWISYETYLEYAPYMVQSQNTR